MSKLIKFFKDRQLYTFGCGVSFCTYWAAHGPKMDGYAEIFINLIFTIVVALFSWCYPIARVINSVFV